MVALLRLLVGVIMYAKGTNRALEKHQPGSAFKPIAVYAPALETGDWHPNSMLDDTKQSFGKYSPSNLSGKYSGSYP